MPFVQLARLLSFLTGFLCIASNAVCANAGETADGSPKIQYFQGAPIVRHFGSEQHGGDANFTAGLEAVPGELLFANADGLLRYSSGRFELQEQTKGVVATSLDRCSERVISAGTVDDLGNFTLDETGAWRWHSWRPKDDLNFGQVWSALCRNDTQYFVASQAVYRKTPGKQIVRIASKVRLNGGFHTHQGLVFTGKRSGLFLLDAADKLQPIEGLEGLPKSAIMTLVQRQDDLLVFFDGEQGVYQLNNGHARQNNASALRILSEQRPYVARATLNGEVVVATLAGEVWWLSKNLEVKMRKAFDAGAVLDLTLDGESGVWVCTERGLFRVSWPAPWTQYADEEGLKSNPNDATRYQDKLWIAASNGVFRLDDSKGTFLPVGILEQQAFSLAVTQDGLLTAYGDGVYNLEKSQYLAIFKDDIVDILYQDVTVQSWLFALRDDGLKLVRLLPGSKQSKWELVWDLPHLASIEKLIPLPSPEGKHHYFVASPRPFELQLDRQGQIEAVVEIAPLPSSRSLNFFVDGDAILANTDAAFWRYQSNTKSFVENQFHNLPRDKEVFSVFQAAPDQQWIFGRRASYFYQSGETPKEITLPRAGLRLTCMIPDRESLLLCDSSALLRLAPHPLDNGTKPFVTVLDSLKRNGERIALNHEVRLLPTDALNFSVRINSSVEPMLFRGRVAAGGTQAAWNEPSRLNSWALSELDPGEYNFEAQGMSASGVWAEAIQLRIIVAGRWWQSGLGRTLAIVLALLVVASMIALLTIWRNRRLAASERTLLLEVEERTQSLAQQALALERLNQRLSDLALRDGLTGVANRRRLNEELENTLRSNTKACLILIDLDHFKRFNDQHGHLAGDDLLSRSAQALEQALLQIWPSGLLARYGGEEFAALTPNADLSTAIEIARSMCAALAQGCLEQSVTASAGVAQTRSALASNTSEDLIARADAALYRAKANGRNQVVAETD